MVEGQHALFVIQESITVLFGQQLKKSKELKGGMRGGGGGFMVTFREKM